MRVHYPTYFKLPTFSIAYLIITFIFLALLGLLLSLGTWQLHRGYEKEALIKAQTLAKQSQPLNELDLVSHTIEDIRYRKVKISGHFHNKKTFMLDNQSLSGQVGYHVLTPFEMSNGQVILVNKGWVAAPRTREQLPEIDGTEGVITIEGYVEKGYVNPLIKNALESPTIRWPLRVQWVDFELLSRILETQLSNKIVVLTAPTEVMLTAIPISGEWLTPERHFGYAFQWYSLAGLLILLSLITLWRAKKNEPNT